MSNLLSEEFFGQMVQKGERDNVRIVLSGSGTSGRLAFYVSQRFNDLLESKGLPRVFRYTIAGGPEALIAAQEQAEDNFDPNTEPPQRYFLKSISKTNHDDAANNNNNIEIVDKIFYVGISWRIISGLCRRSDQLPCSTC